MKLGMSIGAYMKRSEKLAKAMYTWNIVMVYAMALLFAMTR